MTKAATKVSVVIPTKNAGPIFDSVLQEVLRQKTSWLFEILVVDSGSSDGTLDVVTKYPTVQLIQISPSDFGHGKTRNFAVEKTSGEFIAMITQDALPINEHWLAELVAVIEQDSLIAGVFGRHIAHSDASLYVKNELEQHFMGFLAQPIVELDDPTRYKNDVGYRQYRYFFSDNNALIRKEVWKRIPYPEVDFAEDQAWARLIIEAGYRKAYAHDAIVAHSHNYGLIERLQRSFDEAYALQRLFGYGGEKSLVNAVKSFLAITRRDAKIAIKSKLNLKSNNTSLVRMPIENFMRMFGAYLGANGEKIPQLIRIHLSRDKKLMNL
jgi:rhamnosyltransferase